MLSKTLGKYFEFIPVCPELEAGMGVPREPVQLLAGKQSPQMIGVQSGENWTGRMHRFAARKARELGECGISGFIFKDASPSCGLRRVPRFAARDSKVSGYGPGVFAQAFRERFPLVPVEGEGRLTDPIIRENFCVRVFCLHRFQDLLGERFSRKRLLAFHERHRLLIMAHSRKHLVLLEQLTASAERLGPDEHKFRYGKLFMEALCLRPTTAKNTFVLSHMRAHLEKVISERERRNLIKVIDDYRGQIVPLPVPLARFRKLAEKYQVAYLRNQIHLTPHF